MDRPYFHESIWTLEELAKHHATDLGKLQAISYELRHRNTRAARQLREDVILKLMLAISSYFP
jgi:hypothetical protein